MKMIPDTVHPFKLNESPSIPKRALPPLSGSRKGSRRRKLTAPANLNYEKVCTSDAPFFFSSAADKMSDYEDIWNDTLPASGSDNNSFERSLTPAESENQFKAYLASKLSPVNDTISSKDASSSISSSSTISSLSSSKSSYISTSSTSNSLKISEEPSDRILPGLNKESDKESLKAVEDLCRELESATISEESSAEEPVEPVYADPLDALEEVCSETRVYEPICDCDSDDESLTIFEEIRNNEKILSDHESSSDEESICSKLNGAKLENGLSRSMINLSQMSLDDDPNKSASQEDIIIPGCKLQAVRKTSKASSIGPKATNRLSVVLGKYMGGKKYHGDKLAG